jgi:hypothetical protein
MSTPNAAALCAPRGCGIFPSKTTRPPFTVTGSANHSQNSIISSHFYRITAASACINAVTASSTIRNHQAGNMIPTTVALSI